MGQVFRKLSDTFIGNSEIKIAMLGFGGAGKTTILHKLQTGEVVSTIPTVGFNVQNVQHKNMMFSFWEVGGQTQKPDQLQLLFTHAFHSTVGGLIFVVDCLDPKMIGEAKEHFQFLIRDPSVLSAVILVFANKQDREGAMTVREVCEGLGLFELRNRKWHIQGTCAIRGDGLCEGLDWLARMLKENKAL